MCIGKNRVKYICLHWDAQFPQQHSIEAVFLPTSALGIFVQGVVCVWVLGVYVLGVVCVGLYRDLLFHSIFFWCHFYAVFVTMAL